MEIKQAEELLSMCGIYKKFLDQDKANNSDATWLLVAAEHKYGCRCPSCYLYFVHLCGPNEYEDEEFGPFGKVLIDAGRAYLGLPAVVEVSCIVCENPIWDYENNDHYCEKHYRDTAI